MTFFCIVCDEGGLEGIEAKCVYKGYSLCRECFKEYREEEEQEKQEMEDLLHSPFLRDNHYIDPERLRGVL